MALDPNIILQLQGYKPPDQMQGMQQAMTLGNLMQQRQMGDMQMQQQQRALADDQAVRQAYQQAGGDQAKLGEALRASGQYKAYQAFQQSQFDRQKQQAEIAKNRAQANEINQKLIRESMPMLGTNPSDDSVMQASQRLKNLGAFDDAGAKAFAAQFTGLPMDQRGRAIMQFAADPAAYIKMMTPDIAMTDAGGAVVPVDRNAFTNPNQQAIAKTATPGDLLTDARGKASNAIAGGNLRVAQGNLAVNQGRLDLDRTAPKLVPMDTSQGPAFANPRTQEVFPALMGGKPIPPKESEGQKKEKLANENSIAQTQEALAAIKAHPDAFGMVVGTAASKGGALGAKWANSKVGEKGAEARAFVFAKAGSMAHELLGAAQTPSEAARVKSFIPQDTDDATILTNKLNGLMKEYQIKQQVYGGGQPSSPATTGGNVNLEDALKKYGN